MFEATKRLGVALGALSVLAMPVQVASADDQTTACGEKSPQSWQAFQAFGDTADYWLAPGGDFESGTDGWALRGAAIVPENEDVGILPGTSSLELGADPRSGLSTAVTPPFCVTSDHPSFRYVLKANGRVGRLSTFVRYQAADGSTREKQVHSRTATTSLPGQWKPSDLQPLSTEVPMADLGGAAMVRLVFRTAASVRGSSYQLDNVLVDPYRTR